MLCQSERLCLHQTVNMVVFFCFTKQIKKIPTINGRALMQIYRAVPQTKRGN